MADLSRFELKNVKYSAFASHETPCFSARLYVDGKPFCDVSNDGYGGADWQHPITGKTTHHDIATLSEWCRANIPAKVYEWGTVEYDVEGVCAELISDYLTLRDIKRAMKRAAVLYRDGEVVELKYRGKPPTVEQQKKYVADKYADAVYLNDKEPQYILSLIKAAA